MDSDGQKSIKKNRINIYFVDKNIMDIIKFRTTLRKVFSVVRTRFVWTNLYLNESDSKFDVTFIFKNKVFLSFQTITSIKEIDNRHVLLISICSASKVVYAECITSFVHSVHPSRYFIYSEWQIILNNLFGGIISYVEDNKNVDSIFSKFMIIKNY